MKTEFNENKLFQTSDLILATTLYALGFSIDHLNKENPTRVVFNFVKSDELDSTVHDFWADLIKINPKTFASCQKDLKSRIYSKE